MINDPVGKYLTELPWGERRRVKYSEGYSMLIELKDKQYHKLPDE